MDPTLVAKHRDAAVGVPEPPDINAGTECRSFCLKTEGSAAKGGWCIVLRDC